MVAVSCQNFGGEEMRRVIPAALVSGSASAYDRQKTHRACCASSDHLLPKIAYKVFGT